MRRSRGPRIVQRRRIAHHGYAYWRREAIGAGRGALARAWTGVDVRPAIRAHGRPKEKGGAWPPSRRAVSAIAVYAAVLIAAVGSPSNVSRSDRSTTAAISRRRSNLSHRAYTAVTPLRV